VKRHPALVRLSDDHHQELVLARRLQRAADAGPDERLAVASAYVKQFFGPTTDHFRREEETLFPAYTRRAGRTELVERILREHMELHGLARELRAQVAAGDVTPAMLAALGSLLHDHVRVEERELFEEIQRVVPGDELAALDLA
jgi:hemerythrin-like domain-containing protein